MYLLLSVAAGYASVWLWGLVNRSYEGWFKVGGRGALIVQGGSRQRFGSLAIWMPIPPAHLTPHSCSHSHHRIPPPAPPRPPQVCWRVACFFPGVTVAVMTFLNMFLWGTGSSGAIPLGFFFSIIFLWCARALC